jgi:hypothetical protein
LNLLKKGLAAKSLPRFPLMKPGEFLGTDTAIDNVLEDVPDGMNELYPEMAS